MKHKKILMAFFFAGTIFCSASTPVMAESIYSFDQIMASLSKGKKTRLVTGGPGGPWPFKFSFFKKRGGWLMVQQRNGKNSPVYTAGDNKLVWDEFPRNWPVNGTWIFKKADSTCKLKHEKTQKLEIKWKCDLEAGTTKVAETPTTGSITISQPKGPVKLDISQKHQAKAYLDDVRAFVALNPGEIDPLALAQAYGPAVQELQLGTFNKPGSSFLQLVAYTRNSALFAQYHEAQNSKRLEAELAERKVVSQVIIGHVNALRERLAKNPLAPDAFELATLIKKYQAIPENANAAMLSVTRDSLEASLKQLGIDSGATPPTSVATNNKDAARGSIVDLEALSDIEPKDIVILVNLAATAPHAYRDLSGKISFEDKSVAACAPSLASLKPKWRAFFDFYIEKKFRNHKFTVTSKCREGLDGIDTLIVSGTDLAKSQDIPPADQLVNAIEKKSMARLSTIKNSAFNKEIAKREILSDQYMNDINDGERTGYGALAFDTGGKIACTVIDKNIRSHDPSIKQAYKALRFHNGTLLEEVTNTTATNAFRQAQKGNCGLIYGSEKTLKQILSASADTELSPVVLPMWVSTAKIKKRTAALQNQQAKAEQNEVKRKAAIETRKAEAAAKRKAELAQLEKQQEMYREKYLDKAQSARDEMRGYIESINEEIGGALNAGRGLSAAEQKHKKHWGEYPEWYSDRIKSGWENRKTDVALKDYGYAKWDGREVKAVATTVAIRMRNLERGKNEQHCWYFSYLIDEDFEDVKRGISVIYAGGKCANDSKLKKWQAGHQFDSRWDLGVK